MIGPREILFVFFINLLNYSYITCNDFHNSIYSSPSNIGFQSFHDSLNTVVQISKKKLNSSPRKLEDVYIHDIEIMAKSPANIFNINNPMGSHPSKSNDLRSSTIRTINDFATRDSRLGFIRKVYTIFSFQMLATIAVTALIMNNQNIAYFLQKHFLGISTIISLISTGIVYLLISNADLRLKAPNNVIILGFYTLLQSIIIGTISTFVDPRTVCLGTVHTLFAFLAITMYSLQPNPQFDLSIMGNTLLASLVTLMVGTILNLFFRMPFLDNAISALLAVVMAGYISYHTRRIIGGKDEKYQYPQNEYILAALNLYQDVINLFVQIIKILAKSKRRE